jgi:hypothetical protein
MVRLSVSFAVFALLPNVLAATKSFTFNIVNAVVAPDGFARKLVLLCLVMRHIVMLPLLSAVTVNGIYPGTSMHLQQTASQPTYPNSQWLSLPRGIACRSELTTN